MGKSSLFIPSGICLCVCGRRKRRSKRRKRKRGEEEREGEERRGRKRRGRKGGELRGGEGEKRRERKNEMVGGTFASQVQKIFTFHSNVFHLTAFSRWVFLCRAELFGSQLNFCKTGSFLQVVFSLLSDSCPCPKWNNLYSVYIRYISGS